MMKRILTLVAFMLLPLLAGTAQQKDQMVYICTGPTAEVYHKYKDCRGLKACSGDVKVVTLKEAQKTRRKCRICYGR